MFYFRDIRDTVDIAVYFSGSRREKDCEEVEGQKEDEGRRETVSFVNISSIQQIKYMVGKVSLVSEVLLSSRAE